MWDLPVRIPAGVNEKQNMKRILTFTAALLFSAAMYAQSQEVRFFSHRGGRMENDENTLSAFEASYADGYRGFETDVRLTADGQLVILHDTSLDRTTDSSGQVELMTAEQIRRTRTKAGNPVLFLDELLAWLKAKGDIEYIEFELKTSPKELYPDDRLHELCDKLYAAITPLIPEGATWLITSGDYRGLRYIQQKYPDAQMLLITGKPVNDETIDLCKSMGIYRLGATMSGTCRKAVEKAHQEGILVSLWPGKSPEDAVLGAYLGADFLCTDVPHAVKTFISLKTPWIKAEY